MNNQNIKIYQIYYLDEQVSRLDPAFTPYNNCNPPYDKETSNRLREWPIIRTHGLERAVEDKADIWGFVSYKWDEKTLIPGQKFVDFIKNNPDNDVWFMEPNYKPFNPFLNSWVQGDMFHPGISNIANTFFQFNGKEINLKKIPMPLCWYNFFAGTKKFWDTYFSIMDSIIVQCNNNPELKKVVFETGAGHGNDPTVPYFIFIVERMFPTIITLMGLDSAGLKYKNNDFVVEPNNLLDVTSKLY
jgi:hypothetical protein